MSELELKEERVENCVFARETGRMAMRGRGKNACHLLVMCEQWDADTILPFDKIILNVIEYTKL